MNIRKNHVKSAIAALSGASMLALAMSPASALTLVGPALDQPLASSQIELAGWHGDGGFGHGDRHYGGHWGHDYWGHGYWGHGYWGSGYGEYMYPPFYPPSPCSIFGGSLHCRTL